MTTFTMNMNDLAKGLSIGGVNVGRQTQSLQGILASLPYLTMQDGHQGELSHDGLTTHVALEAIELMRFEHDLATRPNPLEALARTSELPGNMRFALAHGKWSILAEVALNGEVAAAMRGAFDRVVAGLSLAVAQAREGEAPTEPNQQDAEAQDQLGGSLALPISKDHLTKDQIADVLALSTIAEEDIVDLDTAWEVRTRWHEDAVPVRVSIDADRLRFRRVLLPKLPAAEQALPVAHHALRLNSQLRQCRLAAVENRIVAETCLSAAEVDAKSVVTAARAIAVASRHCSSSLAVLAAQPGLAGRYQEIFFRS